MAAVACQGKEKTGKVLHEFKGVSGKVSMVRCLIVSKNSGLMHDAHPLAYLSGKEREAVVPCNSRFGHLTPQDDKLIIYMELCVALTELDKFEKGIPDLETFRGSIEVYVSWWSDVDIRQVSTSQRSDISVTSYAPDRLKHLKEQWTKLMDDYRDYVRQVSTVLLLFKNRTVHIRCNRSRSCRDVIQNLLQIRFPQCATWTQRPSNTWPPSMKTKINSKAVSRKPKPGIRIYFCHLQYF